jgi:hypoxanthine phosphoribosyltransferase
MPDDGLPSAIDGTRFAHASEAEMARILDFYDVRWQYEPTTFPILWNLDGEVVESFAPDFYLPDLAMFLEMTTLKQRLVRKKNRKLRRLRELYPDIRIKLFYARDFRAMMLKYGRLGLAESLSGSLGQVVPERLVALVAAASTEPVVVAAIPEPTLGPIAEPALASTSASEDPHPRARSTRGRPSSRRRRRAARWAQSEAAAREAKA